MKTELYRWRVSKGLKSGLERETRRGNISLSTALDLATQCFGSIAGANPLRAESARATVRERLRRKHAR